MIDPTTTITTTPLSPTRQSRFKFHSDINAPNELKEFSAQAHKRHAEFRKRVNALDHNVAAWMNTFVQEVQNRENEMVSMYDYSVSEPLERCAERFMRRMDIEFENMQLKSSTSDVSCCSSGHSHPDHDPESEDDIILYAKHKKDSNNINHNNMSNSLPPSLSSLSEQIHALSHNLMEYIYISIPSHKKDHLDSLHHQFQSELLSKLHTEKTKALKREYAIFQKFESMASLMARRFCEQNAKRIAQLKMLENKILEAGGWDEKRTSRFLEEIQEIRQALEVEREERVKNDDLVLKKIVDCRVKLHKALLESMNVEE
jgi:hypothetical protein